jgi:hypothetical protein
MFSAQTQPGSPGRDDGDLSFDLECRSLNLDVPVPRGLNIAISDERKTT